MPKVIVIREPKVKDVTSALNTEDYKIIETEPSRAMAVIKIEDVECIVLHLGNDISYVDAILSEIKSYDDSIPVIVIAEAGKIEDAVSVMKSGAYDFFQTPIDPEKLRISVSNAARLYNLTKRVYLLENQVGWKDGFDNIVGHCSKMQEIFQLISTIAKSNATVLILGESGTGKELVAKAIHNHSSRVNKNFIDINCGAIPRELLENELFGHERGSYTGADARYVGCCERAHKGSLFLDEICEMDPTLQVKILRLLQERTFSRIGGHETITSDIRFIAATNRDIQEEVKNGNFREDLYYRLNVVPIQIPPLRDRPEDIPILSKRFLEKYSTKNEKIFTEIDNDALECLVGYKWPGNVRELENIIERVVVLHNDSIVKMKYLPPQIQKMREAVGVPRPVTQYLGDSQKVIPLELVEKYAIEAALSRCVGNVSEAARQLKIGQATLYRKIKAYGLKV